MKKYLNLICLIPVYSMILMSCTQAQKTAFSDAAEFGKQFTSVCKVGIKGGDGTLIDTKWVLTAGHVAQGMYKRTNGDLSVYFDNGKTYMVKNVFIHPDFKPMGLYDLALLELSEDVKGITPVRININMDELNKEIVIAGHGDKKMTDGSWIKDGVLRAYTNIIDQVNDTHIIFDYDGPDDNPTEREGTSGPGDSGGPAFIKTGNNYYIAGVSSMGEPGANGPTTFGAVEHFVRVSTFQNWIRETINDPKPSNAYNLQGPVSGGTSETTGLSGSEQAKRARTIISVLENYSSEKMEAAITETYDKAILLKREPKTIMQNMPFLIKELQNSTLDKIRSENASKISVQLKKDNTVFVLDIMFNESSQKIEQLGFGRLN